MQKHYELVLYTAAEKDYANGVIRFIEGKNKIFAHKLYNAQCVQRKGECVFKYLDVLCENRDLKDIVIVDNCAQNYALSIRNGVPIKSFRGEEGDQELVFLANYLTMLSMADDVRVCIKEDFASYLLEHCNVT